MPALSHDCTYLKRDSRDSQISFCFTVFQEKSSSSKAKRVRRAILHLFNHVDSFFRPWTKRMQYPILEKKKGKGKGTKSPIPALWFIRKTIQRCIYYTITRRFGLITFSGLTNSNSTAVFLNSLRNFQINVNSRPRCQKYGSVHNTTQRNSSFHKPTEGSSFSEQQAQKASCNNSNTEHRWSSREVKGFIT